MKLLSNEFVRQFKGRDHSPLVQFIKYGICGGAATSVHILIFYICAVNVFPALGATDPAVRWLHFNVVAIAEDVRKWHALIDNVIAFLFSNLTAYGLNIVWVFERGRHHWALEIGLFYAVSGVSMVIGSILQTWLIGHHGFSTTTAFSANIVTSLLINFALRKFVIFKG